MQQILSPRAFLTLEDSLSSIDLPFFEKYLAGSLLETASSLLQQWGSVPWPQAGARDGAVFSNRFDPDILNEVESETFFNAAKEQVPVNLVTARDHNCMRACALLAITSIQYGQIRVMHQHLGRYYALVAMDGLHDEVNWPKDIGHVEREERRRLVCRFSSL